MEQFIANGLCKGAVYAIMALGFGLIYTTTGVFHVAHGLAFTLGAYGFVFSVVKFGLPISVAIAIALGSAVIFGMGIEHWVYGPLHRKRASSSVMLISSFGVYIIGVNVLAMIFGNEPRFLAIGATETIRMGSVLLTRVQLLQAFVGFVLVVGYWVFLKQTSIGRTCRAVADDPELGQVLGMRVELVRTIVLVIGSLFAAIAGMLAAVDVGMDPHIGMPAVLAAAVACIIGGLKRFVAPALGGMLLAVLQSLVVWQASAHWEAAVTFGILILFLLVRPQGLLGQTERLEEAK